MRQPATMLLAVFLAATPAARARASETLGAEPEATVPTPAAAVILRVETEVFDGDDADPVARSLTLFQDGVAWDFLELGVGDAARRPPAEIVLHDPSRGRVVVIDPERRVATEIAADRLERVESSLRAWAKGSDDALVCWSASEECQPRVEADATVRLDGPGVGYRVVSGAAPGVEAASRFGRFADTAVVLRALLHPGGLPPFPRLAINRHLADAGRLPETVTLELSGGALRPTRVLRSEHRFAPRIGPEDLDRIETASAALAIAEKVDLDSYVKRAALAAAPH